MLNMLNRSLALELAKIQNAAAETAGCNTLQEECAHMFYNGQLRYWLPELTIFMTGKLIEELTNDVNLNTYFGEVSVYLSKVKDENKKPEHSQDAKSSLLMVGIHSLLMNGYTNENIIKTALDNWIVEDNIVFSDLIISTEIASKDIIEALKNCNMIEQKKVQGVVNKVPVNAYPIANELDEQRLNAMHYLWDRAQPQMKPMRHKITWNLNGTCELKNLVIKEDVTEMYINALNIAGHTAYKINPVIRTMAKQKYKRGEYTEEEQQSFLAVAKLDCEQAYYLPVTPDYRLRMYARGGMTTYQSSKDFRAMFDFFDSKDCDEESILIHVANTLYKEKLSYNEAIQKVKDSHNELMTVKQKDLYKERARLGYIEFKETGKGNMVCRIDGTCSGIQITSGLFLDAKTGSAVNVCKSTKDDLPSDIYKLVLDTSTTKANETSKKLFNKHGRELPKKLIMTAAYGAQLPTLERGIVEFLKEQNESTELSKDITELLYSTIKTDYPAILKLNRNLKLELDIAPRHQVSYKIGSGTIKLKNVSREHLNLYGTSYTAQKQGKAIPDPIKLAMGIAPNFVHSLDAWMLAESINIIDGDISPIHDDIGVHSCDMKKAAQAIRTAYVNVIKSQPLKTLYEALEIGDEFEQEDNGMVLSDVLESTYFFM